MNLIEHFSSQTSEALAREWYYEVAEALKQLREEFLRQEASLELTAMLYDLSQFFENNARWRK